VSFGHWRQAFDDRYTAVKKIIIDRKKKAWQQRLIAEYGRQHLDRIGQRFGKARRITSRAETEEN
jgi:hypothetical protein